jgi:hypothetical protein
LNSYTLLLTSLCDCCAAAIAWLLLLPLLLLLLPFAGPQPESQFRAG